MRRLASSLSLAGLLAAPGLLGAQVGHVPERSPFRDLDYRQETTVFGGWYAAGEDYAGVAPKAGPITGVRYDIRLAGPVLFYVRAAGVVTERRVLDPAKAEAQRDLGTQSWPLGLFDTGFDFHVTGWRSYRGLVPLISAGVGVATDFKGTADVGGFKFGTPFAISAGGGLKWVPGGRLQGRLDAVYRSHQIKYPDAYFLQSSDGTRILRETTPQSFWKANLSVTLGLTYLLFR